MLIQDRRSRQPSAWYHRRQRFEKAAVAATRI